MTTLDKLKAYIAYMDVHQKKREAGRLLIEAVAEIEKQSAWKEEDPRMLREQIRIADVAYNTLQSRFNEALSNAEPKTCDGCKWWSGPDSFRAVAECNNPKLKMDSENGLYPTDWNADDPWVETGPKFGCVHWDGK
jgi:hypothetical protein